MHVGKNKPTNLENQIGKREKGLIMIIEVKRFTVRAFRVEVKDFKAHENHIPDFEILATSKPQQKQVLDAINAQGFEGRKGWFWQVLNEGEKVKFDIPDAVIEQYRIS